MPQARSWLTGGANEPITAEQLLTVVDPASLALVAQEAGVEPAAFAEAVAGALPDVVDQASPDGQVDPQLNVRIVGGDEIEPHSHPHQISLR
ncbi:YidB family protein [Nonomuraea sp. NPDC050556]|uniref:YidB family protein n=1 Tax=Nonomuraea sp. NPDC050556 TaxID=3364369 RepID=UPI0037A90E0D